MPNRGWKPYAARVRLAARFLRYYIAAMQLLPDGSRVAVARDGLYRAGPSEIRMSRVFTIRRGSRPLNLSRDGARLLFGEYGGGLDRREVFIYVSDDGGKTFHVGFHFPKGDVQHIHNVFFDPYQPDAYWVFAGDYGRCPGIGLLSKDLRNIDWVQRGRQKYRIVSAIAEPDCLLYGMDTDIERSFIIRMERQSGKFHELLDLGGSSFYAAAFGSLRVISASAEPNPVYDHHEAALYVSCDGDRWERIVAHRKDCYNPVLFQNGTLVLPYSYSDQRRGMYSAQAVQENDGQFRFFEITDHGQASPLSTPRDQ